jgi:micrococcal nuclease
MSRGRLGSAIVMIAVALLVLRPWEGTDGGPASGEALVTRVVDGDTVEARIDGGIEDIRLIGIDTPESVQPGAPVECFGPEASEFLRGLLEGRRVRLVFGVERRDRYGRLLAYVHLGDRFVNAIIVRRGLARTLTIPPNDRHAELFGRLEGEAARAGRGLWGACPP